MTYKLSPSTLKIMEDCPRCFWLHINKNIKRPAGIFPSLPSGVDGVLKRYFDTFRKKGELPPVLNEKKIKAKLFEDEEKLKIWRNNFKGVKYTDKKGNVLHGAVDELLVKDKKIIVLDYKTRGFALKEDTAAHYQHQLDIYNFLLRKEGYETEDYAYLLFYIPNNINCNGDFCFDAELVRMDTDVKRAEKLFEKAITLLEGEEPKASEKCEYCKMRA